MSAVLPEHRSSRPEHLTFRYTRNDDGWITAQIAEFPEAISQGRSEDEAMRNVLDALHDLMHEQTPAERMSAAAQARLDEAEAILGSLLEAARSLAREAFQAAASGRQRIH